MGRIPYLDTLHVRSHALEHLPGDRDSFCDAVLFGFGAGCAHALDDLPRNYDSRHLIGQELRVAQRNQRPDPRHDRNASVLDRREKLLELFDVEHWLGDRVFGARFHFPLEPLELLRGVQRRGIHPNADRELRRLADRVPAGIEPAIQLAHEIGETDRIDVEHRGRVRVRPHLWWITGDEQQIAETNGRRAQKVAQHTKEIPVAAAVVDDRLDPDLLLDQDAGEERTHSALRARAIGHVDRVHPRIAQRNHIAQHFRRIDAARRNDFHRRHEFAARDLAAPL